jgi:hypothetical protein
VRERASEFHFAHNPSARDWVRTDRAGTVLTFQIAPPSDSTQTVKGYIKIYDVIGNLVNQANDPDLIHSLPPGIGGSVYDVDLYWNGSNEIGMPVAPGVYRVVIYVEYKEAKYNNSRMVTNVGIAR